MTRHASSIKRRGGRAIVLTVLAALLGLMVAFASQAGAALSTTGPVDPATKFPAWYGDANGLRLALCLDGPPNCAAVPSDLVAPDGEAFWFSAGADLTTSGGKALLTMATEAAYNGDGPDQESTFDRIRIRVNVSQPGTYTVTYPYGERTYRVGSVGSGFEINDTTDIGCFSTPGVNTCGDGIPADFDTAATKGAIGPFLMWDDSLPAPPAGFIGTPARLHTVVGSPIADITDPSGFQNYFKIAGPNVGGPGVNSIQTRRFAIEGKIMGASPTAVTLNARPANLALGDTTRLSGKLTSFGQPVAGKQVVLYKKATGATAFTQVKGGVLTSGAKGGFRLDGLAPRKNTAYQARFARDGVAFLASRSATERVTVVR